MGFKDFIFLVKRRTESRRKTGSSRRKRKSKQPLSLLKKVEEQKETEEPRVFTVGIEYIYSVSKDSPDMVVAGQVNGTVKVGDEVILTKLGSDDDEPFRTAVYGIQVGEDRVMEASNKKPFYGWRMRHNSTHMFRTVLPLKVLLKNNYTLHTSMH